MDFAAWLAAMPVKDVRRRISGLEQQIAQLEREADVMRVLLAQHDVADTPSSESRADVSPEVIAAPHHGRGRGRRLSPQRQAILDVLREHPDGAAPLDIARALGMGPNPIQTNLSRMTQADMVERIGTGLYRLPPKHPTEGAAASHNGNGMLTLDQPSGSDGEAMDP